jgi:hypothetical protein
MINKLGTDALSVEGQSDKMIFVLIDNANPE